MATNLSTINRTNAQLRIDSLKVALAEAEFDLSSAQPDEPNRDAVIRFFKYNGSYPFAAICASGLWYVTQNGKRSAAQGYPARKWADLVEWIGERNWDSIEVLS